MMVRLSKHLPTVHKSAFKHEGVIMSLGYGVATPLAHEPIGLVCISVAYFVYFVISIFDGEIG